MPRAIQGGGRIDNPALYGALYTADTRAAAIGASLIRFPRWSSDLLQVPSLPDGRRALATLKLTHDAILDLDDPDALTARESRPSRIASPERITTQGWARSVFEERAFLGISWWYEVHSLWTIVGLWNTRYVKVIDVEPLAMDDDDLLEAAHVLGRPVPGASG